MKASFNVRQDLAFWGYAGKKFEPGEVHEVEGSLTEMQAIAAAASAGSLVDLTLDAPAAVATDSIETQAASEAKLAAAMADGTWFEGHAQQMELEEAGGSIEIG